MKVDERMYDFERAEMLQKIETYHRSDRSRSHIPLLTLLRGT